MKLEKAYEVYSTIEEIKEQDIALSILCQAIACHDQFDNGELYLIGTNSEGTPIRCHIPVKKENIKVFLDLLLESESDKKNEILKKIEEL